MFSQLPLEPMGSSMIQAAGYDPDRRILELVFCNGRTRQYLDVPAGVYEGLRCAPSPGRYFMRHIRRTFQHRSVYRSAI